jgi:hypothetical protein
MQELFPVRKTRLNLSWRGWNVRSSCDSAAGLANPILDLPKTSGRSLMPLDAGHEFFVQLAREPDAKRKFLETRDSVLKSDYIIANFSKIFGTSIHDCSRLSCKQFTQGGLCAFNLARQNSFTLYERPDQNMRIGKPTTLTG